MSAFLHFIEAYKPQSDLWVPALGMAGLVLMLIKTVSDKFKYAGILGLISFLMGCLLFTFADASSTQKRNAFLEDRALKDCGAFGAIPAKGGISEQFWQTYCVKLIKPVEMKTGARENGPDDAYSRSCLAQRGTLLYVPSASLHPAGTLSWIPAWGCGTVIAYGTQSKEGGPYVFTPLSK